MNEDSQSIVTEINSCISTAAKRQHGLLKLAAFLENCQSSQQCALFEKCCVFWIKTLLQILENHPTSIHAKLAHYCFYLLIQNSKHVSPELSRTISINFIEKSISIMIASSEQLSKNSLVCLNELMSSYRASCSQYKQKIETYVLSKLDSQCDKVVEWASKCYSKLPYLHKNQNNNVDMWNVYFSNMLKNANLILNEIFEDYQPEVLFQAQDLNENEAPASASNPNLFLNKSEKIFLKLSKDDLEIYFKKLLKRFRACCLALSGLFEPLNEQVVIKLKLIEIIDFLKRVYFFDFKKLLNNLQFSTESKYLADIIGDLLCHTFRFTKNFFIISNTNLIRNSDVINKMLVTIAANLKEKICFNSVQIYFECLTEWIEHSGSNSNFLKSSSNFIDLLIENIKPFKKNALEIDNNKNKSNKSKQLENMIIGNRFGFFFDDKSIINSHQLFIQNKIINSALKCLRKIIKNLNHKFSYNQFEKVQRTIIEILLSIQHNSSTQKPYDNEDCRLNLYKTLIELCLSQNNKLAPPLSISTCIFKNAIEDNSSEIRSYARSSLVTLSAFSCPIMPIYVKKFENEQMTSGELNSDRSLIMTLTQTQSVDNLKSLPIQQNFLQEKQTYTSSSFSNIQSISAKTSIETPSLIQNDEAVFTTNKYASNVVYTNGLISNNVISKLPSTQDSLEDMKNSLIMAEVNEKFSYKRRQPDDQESIKESENLAHSNKLFNKNNQVVNEKLNKFNGIKANEYFLNQNKKFKSLKTNNSDSNGNDHDEEDDDVEEEDDQDEEDEDDECDEEQDEEEDDDEVILDSDGEENQVEKINKKTNINNHKDVVDEEEEEDDDYDEEMDDDEYDDEIEDNPDEVDDILDVDENEELQENSSSKKEIPVQKSKDSEIIIEDKSNKIKEVCTEDINKILNQAGDYDDEDDDETEEEQCSENEVKTENVDSIENKQPSEHEPHKDSLFEQTSNENKNNERISEESNGILVSKDLEELGLTNMIAEDKLTFETELQECENDLVKVEKSKETSALIVEYPNSNSNSNTEEIESKETTISNDEKEEELKKIKEFEDMKLKEICATLNTDAKPDTETNFNLGDQ